MATSGTTSFNPDVATLIEEAYERAGMEGRSGYELRSAIRSLGFLITEMANLGLNLWTIEEITVSMVAGDAQYDLPSDTVDILEQACRVGSSDYRMQRIGVSQWAAITNKTTSGRPTQLYLERKIQIVVNVWPVPETTYTLVLHRLRRVQDAGTPDATLDIPFRFYNAVVAGLSYHLARKKTVIDQARVAMLKQDYDEAMANATYEDREKNSFYIRPKVQRIT